MKRFALLSVLLMAAAALAGDPIPTAIIELPPSSPVTLNLVINLPPTHVVSVDAPFILDITAEGQAVAKPPQSFKGKGKDVPYAISFTTGADGQGALNLKMMIFVCQANHSGVCQKMDALIRVPLAIKPGAACAYDIPVLLRPR